MTSTAGAGITATVDGRTVQFGPPARLTTSDVLTASMVRELEDQGRTAVRSSS